MKKKYWELVEISLWDDSSNSIVFIVEDDEYNELLTRLSKKINEIKDAIYELYEITEEMAENLKEASISDEKFNPDPTHRICEAPSIEKWKQLEDKLNLTTDNNEQYIIVDSILYNGRIFIG